MVKMTKGKTDDKTTRLRRAVKRRRTMTIRRGGCHKERSATTNIIA